MVASVGSILAVLGVALSAALERGVGAGVVEGFWLQPPSETARTAVTTRTTQYRGRIGETS